MISKTAKIDIKKELKMAKIKRLDELTQTHIEMQDDLYELCGFQKNTITVFRQED
jgi:hypothetical protein